MVDAISPMEMDTKRLRVTLASPGVKRTSDAIRVLFDYRGAGITGVQLPIELTILPATGTDEVRIHKVFRRVAPDEYTFRVNLAGKYLVTLKETFHNRYWGSLVVEVEGDRTSPILRARRVAS
jgi:hypothetical protein